MQELGAGFVAAAFAAGAFGFGFDEAAFDGGFEDGGFVALEVGLDALEVGDGFVEAGELFFDFRDDAFLLVEGCEREDACCFTDDFRQRGTEVTLPTVSGFAARMKPKSGIP